MQQSQDPPFHRPFAPSKSIQPSLNWEISEKYIAIVLGHWDLETVRYSRWSSLTDRAIDVARWSFYSFPVYSFHIPHNDLFTELMHSI